jgi:hypothetical protein
LDYHLLLANDLKLISATDYTDLAQQTSEVKRMLTGLLQKQIADRRSLTTSRFQVFLAMSSF